MSWNEVDKDMLELEPKGVLSITFTCPRCGHKQTQQVSADKLLYGHSFNCENIAVCGNKEMYFELELSVTMGSYKGRLDLPLKNAPNIA